MESPCLGSGEGGGLGSNKDGDTGASEEGEADIPGLKIFGIDTKPGVGSWEKTKNSGPNTQEIVKEKVRMLNASDQAFSSHRAAEKKIEDPQSGWDEEPALSSRDPEEVGWIVPPALQSLALCPIEVTQELPVSYHHRATNWPVEVNLAKAVQDLSDYRFSIGQELEFCSSEDGQSKPAQRELEEIFKTFKSCEEQAEELQGYLGVWGDGSHTVRSMSFIDPLEEAISAGKIPYRVVVLGTDESIVEQDSDVPKVASVEVTEEQSEVKKLVTFS